MKRILLLLLPLAVACSQPENEGYLNEPTYTFGAKTQAPEEKPEEKKKPKFSFWDAEMFMSRRCDEINQTLVKKAAVRWDDGTTLYAFMSVAENGSICVSMVSEHKLEVLAADCGGDEKIDDWNYMIATQGL